MTLSNKTYDVLKFLATTGLPAFIAFVGTVGLALGQDDVTALAVTILTAFNTFLGALLGVSTHYYNKED